MKIPEFLEIRGDPFFPNSAVEEVSHVFRADFFLISNLSKFIIFIVIFSHHVVKITFFLISICFDIVFFHGQLGPWTIEQLPIFQMADLPF